MLPPVWNGVAGSHFLSQSSNSKLRPFSKGGTAKGSQAGVRVSSIVKGVVTPTALRGVAEGAYNSKQTKESAKTREPIIRACFRCLLVFGT